MAGGDALNSAGVMWVGSGMTILFTAVYVFVLLAQARAVWNKQMLSPGKDEDAE